MGGDIGASGQSVPGQHWKGATRPTYSAERTHTAARLAALKHSKALKVSQHQGTTPKLLEGAEGGPPPGHHTETSASLRR